MITREMLFPLAFYKKMKFNGSKGKLNYRIERVLEGEEERFLLTCWEGPECYDAAQSEKKISIHPFSEEGMQEIIKVLNT